MPGLLPSIAANNALMRERGVSNMVTKKVEKSGVYRNKAGHAVYLAEGQDVDERMLADYSLDGEATKEREKPVERSFFGGVVDAPQDAPQEQRMQPGAPENKAMGGPTQQKTDAELADAAAKKAK